MKNKNASQKTDIHIKILKENVDKSYTIFCIIIVILKKDDKTDETNYRPLIILPNLSKVYERLMCNQIFPYFYSVFSKFQRGFRKGFNAQQ